MKKVIITGLWVVITPITLLASVFLLHQMVKTKHFGAAVKSSAVFLTEQDNPYKMFAALPNQLSSMAQAIEANDARSLIIKNIFQLYKSPLADYAEFFVQTSDKYGLDFRLLPAIALKESGGGRVIPENSYNPFGWAIHEKYTKRFSSWEEAIETVAKGLREEYLDKGLTTPEQIMTKYTPASLAKGGAWAKDVGEFMALME